jgi:hypothetical protein
VTQVRIRSMFYAQERAADVVQVWRLSDLKLLKTLPVLPIEEPATPREIALIAEFSIHMFDGFELIKLMSKYV